MNATVKPTTWFWVIAGVALLWNLMGLMAFIAQVSITPEMIAELPQAEQDLFAAYPSWMTIVFGAAVIGGVLGCIGLLLRKSWSIPLFIISLVAAIIQMVYSTFMTNSTEVYGPTSFIMPLMVIVICAFLVWYARNSKDKGWIA